jgi:hypothetical protein
VPRKSIPLRTHYDGNCTSFETDLSSNSLPLCQCGHQGPLLHQGTHLPQQLTLHSRQSEAGVGYVLPHKLLLHGRHGRQRPPPVTPAAAALLLPALVALHAWDPEQPTHDDLPSPACGPGSVPAEQQQGQQNTVGGGSVGGTINHADMQPPNRCAISTCCWCTKVQRGSHT